jgi:hypothetical protein
MGAIKTNCYEHIPIGRNDLIPPRKWSKLSCLGHRRYQPSSRVRDFAYPRELGAPYQR